MSEPFPSAYIHVWNWCLVYLRRLTREGKEVEVKNKNLTRSKWMTKLSNVEQVENLFTNVCSWPMVASCSERLYGFGYVLEEKIIEFIDSSWMMTKGSLSSNISFIDIILAFGFHLVLVLDMVFVGVSCLNLQ